MSTANDEGAASPGPSDGRVLVVYAHPHPGRSVANRALIDAVRDLAGVAVRSLYDDYPDFAIDADAERELLRNAHLVVWQHPLYWYSAPALLKLWFEVVLERGWAYGDGGTALAGKDCLWVTTTGALDEAYTPRGRHAHPFEAFVPQIEQTARFCGMRWLDPIVVHGAHLISPQELQSLGQGYRRRLLEHLHARD